MAIIYWWASCRWTNLDGGATAEHSSTLHWVLNRNLRHKTLISAVLQVSTLRSARHLFRSNLPSLRSILLPSCLSPVGNTAIFSLSTLQHSSKQFSFPPLLLSLCFRALRRSRLFLITLRLQSFISYYFLDQTHSLTFYIFPSSSCFPSCAWPFLSPPPPQTLPPLRQCVSSLACSPEDKRLADPLIHLVGSIIHLSDQPTACARANTNTNA